MTKLLTNYFNYLDTNAAARIGGLIGLILSAIMFFTVPAYKAVYLTMMNPVFLGITLLSVLLIGQLYRRTTSS